MARSTRLVLAATAFLHVITGYCLWRPAQAPSPPSGNVTARGGSLTGSLRTEPGNYLRYAHPEFDRLVAEALAMTDPKARADNYRRAERIAVMDDAVWLFLNYYESATLFKPYVKGVVHTPLGEFRIPIDRIRIEKPAA